MKINGTNGEFPIAQCGCYNQNGLNLGAPPGILSQSAKNQATNQCKGPTSGCIAKVNSASMCSLQQPGANGKPRLYNRQFDIISTYWFFGWPNATTTQTVCTAGQYTNCYSGMCEGLCERMCHTPTPSAQLAASMRQQTGMTHPRSATAP